LTNHHVW